MKTILIDYDGVIVDWNKAALKSIGLDDTEPELRKKLVESTYGIEDAIPNFREAFDAIDRSGPDFWANLEVLPWGHLLISIATNLTAPMLDEAAVAICTSPGRWTGAGTGKMIHQKKHFTDIPLIICKEKQLLAAESKFLVDDKPEAVHKFMAFGGEAFLWPNQYQLMEMSHDKDFLAETLVNLTKRFERFLWQKK